MVDILEPATREIVPLFEIVAADPVDASKPILLNGNEFVIVKVSVALATVVIPVPCAKVTVLPSLTVWLEPLEPASVHDQL